MYSWQIAKLERDGVWTREWDPSINPTKPDAFEVDVQPDCLDIFCSGQPYSGELAKCTSALMYPVAHVSFTYELWFDESISFGQVIETDTKFTDAAGWTYDGSFQWNVAKGLMGQIGNPWVDTGVIGKLFPNAWNLVEIDYVLDYVGHTLTVAGVTVNQGATAAVGLPAIAAKQVGWTPNQIVTQLQLCIAAKEGGYRARFAQIGYTGS